MTDRRRVQPPPGVDPLKWHGDHAATARRRRRADLWGRLAWYGCVAAFLFALLFIAAMFFLAPYAGRG